MITLTDQALFDHLTAYTVLSLRLMCIGIVKSVLCKQKLFINIYTIRSHFGPSYVRNKVTRQVNIALSILILIYDDSLLFLEFFKISFTSENLSFSINFANLS